MVEKGVRVAVSWSVVAAIAGIAAVVVTIVYGEIQRRSARRQLRLAQEEAELRPKLVVSLKDVVFHHRPDNPGSRHVQAALVFNVANDGRTAAHHVRCEVRLDVRHLELDDMHGQNRDFFAERLGPARDAPHQVNVGILTHGPTEAHYVCACDEVGESEGSVAFVVPEWKRDEHP